MNVRFDWLIAARLGYVAVILVATLTELHFDPAAVLAEQRLQRAISPQVGARDLVDGLRNVLLFAGWGLVWSITAPAQRLSRSVLIATLTGMLLSTFVETAQLFSPRRQSSVLDVVTNTAGAAAGALLTVLLLRATRAMRQGRSFVGVPMFLIAGAYGAAALLEVALPGLRQQLLPGTDGGPLRRLQNAADLMYFEWPAAGELIVQLAIMVPAGALTVAALVERRHSYRASLVLTLACGLPLLLLAEVARGTTGQPVEPGMFLTHAAGLALGAGLAFRFLRRLSVRMRGRDRPLALLGAWLVILGLWRWRPFWPATALDDVLASFHAEHLLPLQALATRMDLFSASLVAVGFLLYLPVGALLAVWPLRMHGAVAHLLAGLWIVIAVETAQVFIAGLVIDVTEIFIGAAGVLAGWVLVRRAGFRPYGEALPAKSAVDRRTARG